jgi:hypothetical protein
VREGQDREKEFPAAAEVTAFVSTLAPQLALAMGRRTPPLSDAECARPAAALKAPRIPSREAPAQPLGLRRIHAIFRAHVDRRSHGAEDRRIPAENTLAERDLRPTVIARKVRFGSPSEAGAHTVAGGWRCCIPLRSGGATSLPTAKGCWTDSPMISIKTPGRCCSQKVPPETEGLPESENDFPA